MPVDAMAWRQAIEQVCAGLGWTPRSRSMADRTLVSCSFPENRHFRGVLFVISLIERRVAMYVAYRSRAAHWKPTCEALTHVNFGQLGGCLELDPEHGQIRYRDGFLLVRSEVDPDLLRAFVATTLRGALSHCPVVETLVAARPAGQRHRE